MTALDALLLADSRLPTGGHAHSGGVEAAVESGLLRDEADLALFLAGRLRGSGPVLAAAAAAGCLLAAGPRAGTGAGAVAGPVAVEWGRWDGALSARIPSGAARQASRAQGAALLRTARQVWPSAALEALAQQALALQALGLQALGRAGRPHHPLVLGAVVAAAGEGAGVAASLALHHLLGGACAAAVRLLGLDPIAVAALQARAGAPAEQTALAALRVAREAVVQQDPRLLPSTGTPLPEVLAELHAHREVTFFAS
jgi:urease accessory protein